MDDRVSRTQFQYALEDAEASELAAWTPRLVAKLQARPELRDVASDQQSEGQELRLTIDRDTASRLGVLPQALDDTLYDAFGQRQVSTIFTQLNQYHVVLEADKRFQQSPAALGDVYVRSSGGEQVPLSAFTRMETVSVPLAVNHQGQFPLDRRSPSTSRPGRRSGTRSAPSRRSSGRSACPRASRRASRGRRRPSGRRSPASRC